MNRTTRHRGTVGAAALMILACLLPAASYAELSGPTGRTASDDVLAPAASLDAVERALRSVVVISPEFAATGSGSGGGSGFVFDREGHVITNAHVVGRARTVTIGLFDGRRAQARVVGVDARTDIAVIRLPAGVEVPALELVETTVATPRPGAPVFALGSPLGFDFSVTSGIVSGGGRSYDVLTPVDFLQHDAALNPGNSGGPLIDAAGRVLGVNTATPAQTIFDIGIGLAIPADVAAGIARRLIETGTISRGALGIRLSHADEAVAEALGGPRQAAALVDEVQPGGAAARAGLLGGDLILTLDGETVALPRDVLARTMGHRPGDRVTVDFLRAGQRRSALVTLQPDELSSAGPDEDPRRDGPALHGRLGLRTDAADGIDGVVIVDVEFGSPAQLYGLGAGDVIQALNGVAVTAPADFDGQLERAEGRVLVFRIERPGLGVRHINIPRTAADSISRRPGMASEQQSPWL